MFWFKKKEKIEEPIKMIEVSVPSIIDVRKEILTNSRKHLDTFKRLCSFFNNNILNDILDQSEFIYDVFDKNEELNIKKLEQYNYYYTENLIELLEKLKKSREENIIILDTKVLQIKNKLSLMDIKKVDTKIIDNEKKKWANYISDQLFKCYKELCNDKTLMYAIDTNYKLSELDKNFTKICPLNNIYSITNTIYDTLDDYNSEDCYISSQFTIHKKLIGKLNKNVFNIEFKYTLMSESTKCLYIFMIKDTTDYFLFVPEKMLFKLVNSSDVLIHIASSNSSWSKHAELLEQELIKYEKYNTDLLKQRTIWEEEMIDILNKYLTKVNDIELLNSLQEIDVNRRNLETILGLQRFDI